MYILFWKESKKETHAKEKHQSEKALSEEVFSIWSHDGKIMFENIIEATDSFNDKYLIGVGGQGRMEAQGAELEHLEDLLNSSLSNTSSLS